MTFFVIDGVLSDFLFCKFSLQTSRQLPAQKLLMGLPQATGGKACSELDVQPYSAREQRSAIHSVLKRRLHFG
ncbi:MAG: hypothetical protein WAM77_30050 [Xanthobacteraceae bacterium]|jgi:hypothetical protein